MASTSPRNAAIAGPTEKSNLYANRKPASEESVPLRPATARRGPQRDEKSADMVAGIMRNANTTTTPAIRTVNVITIPSSA